MDVEVTGSPDALCDGIYYGEPLTNEESLRGPTQFQDLCLRSEECKGPFQE